MFRAQPGARALDPEAAIQAYLFQFFAVMLVLIPVTSSMSLAAYSVVGEKQARTLEPLLVTPITTFELLGAKVLGAFIPSIALTVISYVVYVLIALVLARPGVAGILLGARAIGDRLRARPIGRTGRAADGCLRVVTRQRRQDGAADRRPGDSADPGAARRPAVWGHPR